MGQCVEIVSLITISNPTRSRVSRGVAVEVHRFRRDFLLSSRAGQDRPARPEPSLLSFGLRAQGDTSKVVPYHSPA